jgi:uncharacterized protein involved in exopolysaccharide biosynthesis
MVETCDEAVKAIERLEAEIYRKEKRIEAWKKSSDEHEEEIERLRAERDAALQANRHYRISEQLWEKERAKLQAIVEGGDECPDWNITQQQ